jgi:hypothetical protein
MIDGKYPQRLDQIGKRFCPETLGAPPRTYRQQEQTEWKKDFIFHNVKR